MKHDFQGCPSLCVFCEIPLLDITENEDCDTRTISVLKERLDSAENALKEYLECNGWMLRQYAVLHFEKWEEP